MLKSILVFLLVSVAGAFTSTKSPTALRKTAFAAYRGQAEGDLNGWRPDKNQLAWGLPGAIEPFAGGFDPLNLASDLSLAEAKRFRESEVTHSRVAMLAVIGFLVTELGFHPLFGAADNAELLGIYSLGYVRQIAPFFFEILFISIGAVELGRALIGWVNPVGGPAFTLAEDYYPGDVGFDPLGLKPKDAREFADMQTKELQHGRLAMLAIAAFVTQELVDNQMVLTTSKKFFGVE